MEDNNNYSESADSWEIAVCDRVGSLNKRTRKDVKTEPLMILHNMLQIFSVLSENFLIPVIENSLARDCDYFEKERIILKYLTNEEFAEKQIEFQFYNTENQFPLVENNKIREQIKKFLTFNLNGCSCRIYFVLNQLEVQEVFLEYKLKNVVEHSKKYNGHVFSIDIYSNIEDQTYYFSKSFIHWNSYKKILEIFNEYFNKKKTNQFDLAAEIDSDSHVEIESNSGEKRKDQCFEELDNKRISIFPKSAKKFKHHPLYIVESMLKQTEIIFPKRLSVGKANDENVYLRKNMWKIKSRNNWYFRYGKVPKDGVKPYRILHKREHYAIFQMEDIHIESVNEYFMIKHKDIEGYHENFIPKDCSRIFLKSEIEKKEFVKFLKNTVGEGDLRYTSVKKALYIRIRPCIVVYKTDLLKYQRLYEYYSKEKWCMDYNAVFEETIAQWRNIIKKLKRKMLQ